MYKFPITQQGYDKLEEELRKLKLERPKITSAIAEARSHGDLSENAEYHAARESLALLEAKIVNFENLFSHADIIDYKKLSNDTIKFGASVSLIDDDTNETVKYIVVGTFEADLTKNRISIESPLAKALIGKKVGDIIEVSAPKGAKSYEVIDIAFEEFQL